MSSEEPSVPKSERRKRQVREAQARVSVSVNGVLGSDTRAAADTTTRNGPIRAHAPDFLQRYPSFEIGKIEKRMK